MFWKKFNVGGVLEKIESQRGLEFHWGFWIESPSGICWFWLRRGVLLDNKITLPIQAEPGERICVCVTNIGPAGSGYHRLTISVCSPLFLLQNISGPSIKHMIKTNAVSRHCGTCHDPCALHFHMEEPDEDFVAFVS